MTHVIMCHLPSSSCQLLKSNSWVFLFKVLLQVHLQRHKHHVGSLPMSPANYLIILAFSSHHLLCSDSDLLLCLSFDALRFFLLLLKCNVILPKAESVSLATKEVLNLHIILIKPVYVHTCNVQRYYV